MKNRPTKKSVPNFTTLYPTKKELDHLANNGEWDKLDKRLKDKTTENAIRDIVNRRQAEMADFAAKLELGQLTKGDKQRMPTVPFDILKKIALYMDIRDVLTQSTKNSDFLVIVTKDDFWKTRFELDFPEVLYAHRNFIYEKLLKDTWGIKNNPWKRYYLVVRYYMHSRVFPLFAVFFSYLSGKSILYLYDIPIQGVSLPEKKNYYFNIEYDKKRHVFYQEVMERETKRQLGKKTCVSFEKLLNYFCFDRVRYLIAHLNMWINLANNGPILKSSGLDCLTGRKAGDEVFSNLVDLLRLKKDIVTGYVKSQSSSSHLMMIG